MVRSGSFVGKPFCNIPFLGILCNILGGMSLYHCMFGPLYHNYYNIENNITEKGLFLTYVFPFVEY